MHPIPEADWKYLRSVKDELLSTLCERINDEALRLVQSTSLGQHKKFLALYQQVMNGNGLVADCFDDWRRSTIFGKLLVLRKHRLLTEKHISRLSVETQERLEHIRLLDAS